jgi:hypothetical protein
VLNCAHASHGKDAAWYGIPAFFRLGAATGDISLSELNCTKVKVQEIGHAVSITSQTDFSIPIDRSL